MGREPISEPAPRFGGAGAAPTSWAEGRERLEGAEAYWTYTVRPGGTFGQTLWRL